MSSADEATFELTCTECRFSKIVGHDADKPPAKYVREHGKETGHLVSVTFLESE